MSKNIKSNMNKPCMIAFLFDSSKIGTSFYGSDVFNQLFKGKELTRNTYKMIFSSGDIFDREIYDDISPFTITDELCTINNHSERFADYPFAVLIEDIETNIAITLDNRLKKEFAAYVGMTSIDIESKDQRKQFWKNLIRTYSVEGETITCFGDELCGFAYYYEAKKLGFHVNYDGFPDDCECENQEELFSTRKSSFIFKIEQLKIISGKNDSDRGLSEMNYSLVKEVELAGVQIWKAIEDINHAYIPKEKSDTIVDYIFTSLYQASQGIERLFKIVIELIAYIDNNKEKSKTDELLFSHNHVAMYEYIEKKQNLTLDTNCKKLLSLLNTFYSSARYNRYSYSDNNILELKLLQDYGSQIDANGFDDTIKHLYGKSLGRTAQKTYELIMDLSIKLNIYVYELNAESVACFVLYKGCNEDIYETLKRIEQAKKEFLWYLIKKGHDNSFAKAIDTIEPLDFDPGEISDFIHILLTNKNACSRLHDFVDYAYDEFIAQNKQAWKDHKEAIEAVIGNNNFIYNLDEDD